VAQSGTDLLISHAFDEFAGLDHFFQQGQLVFLAMTSGPSGTVIYKDGRQAGVFSGFKVLANDLSGDMVIGNSAVDLKPWHGELRGLAIYSRELSSAEVLRDYHNWTDRNGAADLAGATARYPFTERAGRVIHNAVMSAPNLEIPKWFELPGKGFLNSPAEDFEANWGYLLDLLENIVGFVPLGFILCAYLATTRSQRRAILYAAVAAGILSLAIEVLQAYIPLRGSDVTDIITNTLGAFCGALLARPRIVRRVLEKNTMAG
jgi:VanZ family protein